MNAKQVKNPCALHDEFWGALVCYNTGDVIRGATLAERIASLDAAKKDGGSGVILVDGRSVYVEDR